MDASTFALPTTLDFKAAFLTVFGYVVDVSYSRLGDPSDYVDEGEPETLREDLAGAISETLQAVGIGEDVPAEHLGTLYDWLTEANPDLAAALDATTDR